MCPGEFRIRTFSVKMGDGSVKTAYAVDIMLHTTDAHIFMGAMTTWTYVESYQWAVHHGWTPAWNMPPTDPDSDNGH